MEETPKESLLLKKTQEEITEELILKVAKMLSKRKYHVSKKEIQPLIKINSEFTLEKYVETKIKDLGDYTYEYELDNGTICLFKILFEKLTGIGKNTPISEFITNNTKTYKIIAASDYNAKVADSLSRNGNIYKISSLLMDIMEHRFQPEFIQLTKDEMENIKNAWCASNEDIPKIKMSDPVAKYLGLKKNEIIKIIRCSPTSGEVIAYKIVS